LTDGKRVMLDPTWRLYLKDKYGKYISLPRLRNLLLADEPIFENASADYNGTGFDKEYHRNYMIKNTFRFARCTLNKDGIDGPISIRPEFRARMSGPFLEVMSLFMFVMASLYSMSLL